MLSSSLVDILQIICEATGKLWNLYETFSTQINPLFAICHGPQLLITAQLIEGRKVTGWRSIVQDIKNAGAEFLDQEVVEDGNLITSRQPSDIPAFIEACLKKLE